MISQGSYKGAKAVFIESRDLLVAILPEIGGKVASIFNKNKEFELLFQNPFEKYENAKLYEDFGIYDASGFDDCFPTINECSINYGQNEIILPNHGEVWSTSFSYSLTNESVTLSFSSAILPYTYVKILRLDNNQLIIDYNIENSGEEPFPCIWTMHSLIRCEEDMELIFPKGTKEILNVFPSKYLGEIGTTHAFPTTHTPQGQQYHLDRILPLSSSNAEKYYVKGEVTEGICGVYYPQKDVTYMVYWDEKKLPYLGFWITEGGFRGDYNCALEPANGYYDDIDTAKKNGKLFYLEAGKALSFSIKIELT